MNKQLLWIIIGVVGVLGLIIISIMIPQKENEKVPEDLLGIDYNIEGNETTLNYDNGNPIVAMYIKDYGSIVIELYSDVAPNTVANFISLVKEGFYDQNTFHRLMPGFVLQGGDPTGTGSGGPDYAIKGEFTENGFENNLSHEKWVVSMARTSDDMDSAGSQFFICLDDATYLDGSYATFGKVIDGFDIIQRIEKNERVADSSSGKLQNNLTIVKALVDLKGKSYPSVEVIQ
jgi:peptidyl-prolyl cis-trans isomerase B (cyclophilin B)